MTLSTKRLLIFFSVFLNVGFIIMAAAFMLPHFMRGDMHMVGFRGVPDYQSIIEDLDLKKEQRQSIKQLLAAYQTRSRAMRRELRHQRLAMIKAYAQPGILNQDEVHSSAKRIEDLVREKNLLLLNHFRELQKLMGPAKSREFFMEIEKRYDRHVNSR